MRLVKLPWSHPSWRPWRRYAPAEKVTSLVLPGQGALVIVLRPERFPWGRVALLLALGALVAIATVQARRAWRTHRNPRDRAEYLTSLAQIHLELQDRPQAIVVLTEANRLLPQDPRIAAGLADLLRAESRDEEAERLLRAVSPQAIQRDPTLAARLAASLLRRGRGAEAWQVVSPVADALLRVSDRERTHWLLIAGVAARDAGALLDAESLLKGALRSAGPTERGPVLTALGDALLRARKDGEAQQTLEEALRLRPGERETTLLFSRTLACLGRFQEALAATQALLQGSGANDPAVIATLGELHLLLGQRDAARALAARLGESPAERAAGAGLRARAALQESDLAGADAECISVLALDPANRAAHVIRIGVARQQGDLPHYREVLETAHATRPDLLEAELGLLELDCLEARWAAAEERAVRLAGDPRARGRALQAFSLAFARPGADLSRGLARLRHLAARFPGDPLLRAYQAVFAVLAGEDREGKALAELAGQADLAGPFAVLAQLQMGRTDALESVELLTQLVEREQRFAPARIVLAAFYEQLQRPDLALREVEAAQAAAPKLREGRLARARLAVKARDPERAITELNALPQDPLALTLLAEVRLQGGKAAEAVSHLQRAAALAPRDPVPLLRLARAQSLAGTHEHALATLARVRALGPHLNTAALEAGVHLDQGDLEAAEGALRRAHDQGGQPVHAQVMGAVRALRGARDEALGLLQPEPAQPDTAERALLCAMLAAEAGRASGGARPPAAIASEVWAAARALQPCPQGSSHAATRQALETFAFLALGFAKEAERRALTLDPANLDALQAWWGARACQGDEPARIRPFLERLTVVAPGGPLAWIALAGVTRALDGPEAALAVLDRARAALPGDGHLAVQRGMRLHELGRLPQARAEYERALGLGRPDPIAMNNLAELIGREPGGREEALRLAREALRRFPRSGEVRDTLGWLLLEGGQLDEALEQLSWAVALVPADPRIRVHLAQALRARGELLRARNHLRIALLAPRSEDERAPLQALLREVEAQIEAARRPG